LIISIYSPKGGVGNTVLTLALARQASNKVKTCALEFDFTPGDFPSILDIDRRKNIYTAMRSGFEQAVQRPDKEDFDAIVAGYPDVPERFTQEELYSLINDLNKAYDLILADVQPTFIPAVMDIMHMSDKIILLNVDVFSVVSRTVGMLDWAVSNNFVELDKMVQVINMRRRDDIECVNQVGPQIPVIYSLPYIRNIKGYTDKRLEEHCRYILHNLMPDTFEIPKQNFFKQLFGKKEAITDNGTAKPDGEIPEHKPEQES
jgi:MinD-like ATPase involved in chromosome partitioning or flagellar assembly